MNKQKRILVVCTTDSMIWNFLVPHIKEMEKRKIYVECACSRTGFFFDELENKYKIKMTEIPFHRSPYSIDNIKAYAILKKIIKQKKIDTLFCHEPVGGAIGRLVGHACKCNVIYMAHGFHFFKGAPKLNWLIYYPVEKLLARYTDVLLTINKEDYILAKQRFKCQKISLINGIGVDLNKFKKEESNYLREKFKLDEDDMVCLSVGELIKRKNHITIIEAIKEMNNPKIHLFIAGEGELQEKLQAYVNTNQLSNNIHFLGFCTNVSKICNSCDVFIFPSIQEGLSMALMEAMACGKSVIASRIRGNTDLIDDEKGGYLVETFDVQGYKNSLKKLWKQHDLRLNMGVYNLEKVQKYSINNVVKQISENFR